MKVFDPNTKVSDSVFICSPLEYVELKEYPEGPQGPAYTEVAVYFKDEYSQGVRYLESTRAEGGGLVISKYVDAIAELAWPRWQNCLNIDGKKLGEIVEYRIPINSETPEQFGMVVNQFYLDKYLSREKPLNERLEFAEKIMDTKSLFNQDFVMNFFTNRGLTYKIEGDNILFFNMAAENMEGFYEDVIKKSFKTLKLYIAGNMFVESEYDEFDTRFGNY